MSVVIKVENLSKYYRLGVIGGGTLREDLSRWWALKNGKLDPTQKIGEENQGNRKDGQIWAIKDINFEVAEGEILGIIGGNGAGKSTLLKILSRITAPTSGCVKINGRVASLLEVGTGFHPELTGRENVYLNGTILGMSRREIAAKFEEIISFAGMEKFVDTPVKRYSSGMSVRLAFAVAAHLEPEIMVVDEVLAVGDAAFQKKCLGKMGEVSKAGRTIIFVSHNMSAVRSLCGDAILLEAGKIRQIGNSAVITDQYLSSMLARNVETKALAPGFIYCSSGNRFNDDFLITGIELLDAVDQPKLVLGSWDFVKIRIHLHAKRLEMNGSVVIEVKSREGTTLMLCSTQPDSKVKYKISVGSSFVDCIFPVWPLAAGDYTINARLAIPNVRYLSSEDCWCDIQVVERDIFASGMPPRSDRYIIACEHEWQVYE